MIVRSWLRRIVYADEVTLLQQLQQEIEYHYKAPLDACRKMGLKFEGKTPQIWYPHFKLQFAGYSKKKHFQTPHFLFLLETTVGRTWREANCNFQGTAWSRAWRSEGTYCKRQWFGRHFDGFAAYASRSYGWNLSSTSHPKSIQKVPFKAFWARDISKWFQLYLQNITLEPM